MSFSMNFFRKSRLHWHIKRKFRRYNKVSGSPSQYGQDQVVFDLLNKPESGIFIDIGANDGINFSNSLFFEQKKWKGVCVEPHPVIFRKLSSVRSCDCLNACVANNDSTIDFLVVEGSGSMLSGIPAFFSPRHMQRIDEEISAKGGQKRFVSVEAITPKELLDRFNINEIDYLSIDTEGCELMILKLFDFSKTDVKVIGVENGSRTSELFDYLTSVGYALHKCVGCDEIYLNSRLLKQTLSSAQ